MKILICKVNEPIIKGILPKVKFTESSINTSFFRCSEKTFNYLYNEVKLLGYNPFSLLSW